MTILLCARCRRKTGGYFPRTGGEWLPFLTSGWSAHRSVVDDVLFQIGHMLGDPHRVHPGRLYMVISCRFVLWVLYRCCPESQTEATFCDVCGIYKWWCYSSAVLHQQRKSVSPAFCLRNSLEALFLVPRSYAIGSANRLALQLIMCRDMMLSTAV